jgi:hypothetical protein
VEQGTSQVKHWFVSFVEMNNDDENNEKQNLLVEELLNMEKPRSWSHLIKVLFQIDELKYLKEQNADGYFYLLYIKTCFQMLCICNTLHVP